MSELSIPQDVNIGLEIEVNGISKNDMEHILSKFVDYKAKYESTIGDNGSEIATPIIHNKINDLKKLKEVLIIVQNYDHSFDDSSLQINFDLNLIESKENLIGLLKFISIYEDIIFHYSIGEELFFRDSIEIYASPIKMWMLDYCRHFNDANLIVEYFTNNRINAINLKRNPRKFKNDIIEYRSMNSTIDYDLIIGYINFFYYLTIYSNKMDKEKINYRFSKSTYPSHLASYYRKRIKKAEELADTIFENDKDKTLFLTQYERIQSK